MNKTTPKAQARVIKLLSLRDHSEKELRQKLSKNFLKSEIDEAIEFAKRHRLIPTTVAESQKLAAQFARYYTQRRNGPIKINQALSQKGLPPVTISDEQALTSACELIQKKLSRSSKVLTPEQLIRYLLSRGFSLSCAQKATRLELSNRAKT